MLAGCVIFVPTGPGEISSGDAPQSTTPVDAVCRNGEVELDQSESSYDLAGTCDLIVVSGNDILVVANEVERIELRGDRASVKVDRVDSVLVSGNDNSVEIAGLDGLDAVEITGDRAAVRATGVIDSAIVNGDENTVESEVGIETIADSGERNSFAP